MANAGTVTVDFAAEVAKFNASLKQVNDRVKSVESSFKSIEKVANTALKFFSVGIALNFIRSAGEAADQLGKTADKLGIATERLAAFQLAANDAGVETATLNKLLSDAQQRLGDASFGTGDALKVIRSFGLSVAELQRLKPDELFLRYADSIGTLKTRSDQFSAAQALFGKSAKEAFTLIEGGRPGIDAAAATVEKLGLALSRVDIFKIEEANDKIALLGKTSQAFGGQIAAAIAPFASAFVDAVTNSGVAADEARTKIDIFVRSVALGFGVVANAAHVFDAAVSGAFAALAKSEEITFAILRKGFELTASIDRAAGLDSLAGKFEAFSKSAGEAEAFAASLVEQAALRATNALDGIRSFEQLNAGIDAILDRAQAKAEAAAKARAEANASLSVPGSDSQVEAINTNLLIEEDLRRLHYDRMLEQQRVFEESSAELTKRLDHDEFVRNQTIREQSAIQAERNILGARQAAANAGIALLQSFAGKSKAVAIALVAINKAVAIAQAIQNTGVAVTKTLAAYGGTPAGYAAAASVKAWGALEVAAIAASGLAEIQQIRSSPSAGAPLGSPTNPIFTGTAANAATAPAGAQQKPVTQINVFGWSEGAIRDLVRRIKDEVGDHDLTLIRQS